MNDPFLEASDYYSYTPLPKTDPAYWMLERGLEEQAGGRDGWISKTDVYDPHCYICRDPEFALMGLPLCKSCPVEVEKGIQCGEHVPADDPICSDGHDVYEWYMELKERSEQEVSE